MAVAARFRRGGHWFDDVFLLSLPLHTAQERESLFRPGCSDDGRLDLTFPNFRLTITCC